jgi:membrane peptidoglycan carboxypeptidase
VTTGLLAIATLVGIGAAYVDSVPLPDDPVVPQASELYYSDGRTVLARVGVGNRTDVPLERIPLAVRRAVLAAEDRGFYDHAGVSMRGILRAAWSNVTADRAQGASTITQQYVRNAYLSQERTVDRKAREAALALKIERRYTKDQLLGRYLNTIYFGRGAYGIQAAAQAYFGATVDRLTAEQGAVLAALIRDPWNMNPAVNPEAARDRWHWILTAMADQGWADRAAVAHAAYPPIVPRSTAGTGALGVVVDAVERELAGHGVAPQALYAAGLRVVTTVDRAAQNAAVDAVTGTLGSQPAGLRAALVAVEPATGEVRAYYGGNEGRGFFDDAIAPRPAASTFKPFVLAVALRRGISYESRWDGSSPRLFPGRLGVPLHNRDGLQRPDCTLDEAMALSLNTPFYAVAERVGPEAIRGLAVGLGIPPSYAGKRSLADQPGDPRPGRTRPDIALGRYPVAPADLATAYATLAAGGVRADRHLVRSVTGPGGEPWYTAKPAHRTVLPAPVSADVTTVLARTLDHIGALPGRPAAGKSGTQQWGDTVDNQDAWMAGYTPDLATVVWVGRAVPGPIRDAAGHPIQGDTVPAQVWRRFMTAALDGHPVSALPTAARIGSRDAGDRADAAVRSRSTGKPQTTGKARTTGKSRTTGERPPPPKPKPKPKVSTARPTPSAPTILKPPRPDLSAVTVRPTGPESADPSGSPRG